MASAGGGGDSNCVDEKGQASLKRNAVGTFSRSDRTADFMSFGKWLILSAWSTDEN